MTIRVLRKCFPLSLAMLVSACGGGGGGSPVVGSTPSPGGGGSPTSYLVSTSATVGGSISPAISTVAAGTTISFTLSVDPGYVIENVSGCDGTLDGNIYTTGIVNADCSVTASYKTGLFDVAGSAAVGGQVAPMALVVDGTDVANFAVVPSVGYKIARVTGCGGTLVGSIYTTSQIVSDCDIFAEFEHATDGFGRIDLVHRSPELEPNVDSAIIGALLFCTGAVFEPSTDCRRWNHSTELGSPVTVRYSFSGLSNGFPDPEDVVNISYRDFLESEKQVIRGALQQVEDVTQLEFVETTDIYGPDVINFVIQTFGLSTGDLPPSNQAEAEQNQGSRVRITEDTLYLLDRGDFNWAYDEMHDRSRAAWLIVHELGHALGLKHPFENFAIIGGGQYEVPTLPPEQDNGFYTAMSYGGNSVFGPSPDHLTLNADSFHKYDLLALQALYGLNNPEAGEPKVFSFSDDYKRRVVVHDVNQNATLDFSATLRDAIIDLRPGAFSSYAVNLVEYVNDTYGNYQNRSYNNMALSYDTQVARVMAGSGNDIIVNSVGVKEIAMGGGNDVLLVGSGAIESFNISGEGGVDMVNYREALSEFSVQPIEGSVFGDVSVQHIVSGVTYTLQSVEFLVFGSQPYQTTELCECLVLSN